MKNILIILLFPIISFSKNYYVSPSGSSGNTGTSTASPWTMAYAASSSVAITAGDNVFVKSGSYSSAGIIFYKSGTLMRPINWIGYTTTPGDQPSLAIEKADPYTLFTNTVTPTFTGSNRNTGIGFDLSHVKNVSIKNIQLTLYSKGIYGGSADSITSGYLTLDNIFCLTIGSTSSSYDGYGIVMGSSGTVFGNHCIISRCLVVNSAAEGISVYGDANKIYLSKVYCNDATNNNAATDYYVAINGNDNWIDTCYIYRLPGLWHNGHGYTIASNNNQVAIGVVLVTAYRNRITRCVSVNMQGEGVALRHSDCKYNDVSKCYFYGTHTGVVSSGSGEGNAITIRDGATENTIKTCRSYSCSAGIAFLKSGEDSSSESNGSCGIRNIITECVFFNSYIGIYASNNLGVSGDAGDNIIAHNTFVNTRYHISCSRPVQNLKIIGNIFYGDTPDGAWHLGTYASTDAIENYTENCFFDITGTPPSATIGVVTSDPLFRDYNGSDYRLQSGSPCLNAVNIGRALIKKRNSRGIATDNMGAY